MATSKPWYRVDLQLDLRIKLEAIILRQLQCIPNSRRQEWLRGLLVKGFLVERQVLRGVQAEQTHRPSEAFRYRPAAVPQQARGLRQPAQIAAKTGPSDTNLSSKPFASLGKVIGGGKTATR